MKENINNKITSKFSLLIAGVLIVTSLISCKDSKNETSDVVETETETKTETKTEIEIIPEIVDSTSTLFDTQVTSADYSVVIDESNYEDVINTYEDVRLLINEYEWTLLILMYNKFDDYEWEDMEVSVDCPVSGTFTYHSQINDLGIGLEVMNTQDCELSEGAFDFNSETNYRLNSIDINFTGTFSDSERSITMQKSYVNSWASDDKVEILINDSDIGQYFMRSESEYEDGTFYGSNDTYVSQDPLNVYDESNVACTYETNLNGLILSQKNCTDYFDIEIMSGSWESSGGQNSRGAGNIFYELTVLEDANISIALNADADADTYLYVLDQNYETIAENDDVGSDSMSGLGMMFSAGTYYITAATFLEGSDADFEILIKSDTQNSATINLYVGDIVNLEEEIVRNEIDSISGSWIYSGGDDAGSLGNSIYELTVSEKLDFEILLNTDLDSYLYVQDQLFQTIDYNDDIGANESSGLTIELSPGTYYIVAATYDVGEAGDFEVVIKSTIQNTAMLSLYQEAIDTRL